MADVWAAGDDASVPDLAARRPGAHTVSNAQHAVRQGKRLAKNILATLRGRAAKSYVHHNLGVVATLGLGRGIVQYRRLVIKGFPAWLMHRGYHVLAVPTWERKVRVLAVWITAALYGRDVVSPASVQHPRDASRAAVSSPRTCLFRRAIRSDDERRLHTERTEAHLAARVPPYDMTPQGEGGDRQRGYAARYRPRPARRIRDVPTKRSSVLRTALMLPLSLSRPSAAATSRARTSTSPTAAK